MLFLTGGEQRDNEGMSEAVKQNIKALVKRNKDEPEQRLAEVSAIKEVNPFSIIGIKTIRVIVIVIIIAIILLLSSLVLLLLLECLVLVLLLLLL